MSDQDELLRERIREDILDRIVEERNARIADRLAQTAKRKKGPDKV